MQREIALACPRDLNRRIRRSRIRVGWWEFSARLFIELIGHDHPWHEALFLQQFAEEPMCRLRVSMSLQQDIQHVALGIHRSPQIILLPFDCDYHLIQMPLVRNIRTFALQLIRVLLSKFLAPFPNRFVGHLNPSV